jgi:hypothetical protein
MRYMKFAWFAASITICLLLASNAEAITISQPATDTRVDSPIIMTGYGIDGAHVQYVQVFNSSSEVIDVTNWTMQAAFSNATTISLVTFHGLIKPGGYLVVADTGDISTPDIGYVQTPSGEQGAIGALQLTPSSRFLPQTQTVKTDANHSYWRRNISSSTGNYLSTFSSFIPDAQFMLYGNGFYEYPENVSLQVTEILANPRNCSPVEGAGDCRDYVKLYNPSTVAIDLSQFRMRVGYQGQNVSSSNTFSLQGIVAPGHFVVISESADSQPVSLTNSSSFVWLEDTYGVKTYDSTVVEYPDAGADSKKGQAWAYDSSEGIWKWTIQPTPFDSPSVFPVPISQKKITPTASLTPCKEGQYRSEETNRCRSTGGVTAAAPCDDDEERNPATNRCRKLATAASQNLAACKEGQERNPATNRCRNVASSVPGSAAFAVETAQDAGKAFIGWWALGGVGVVALGYGAWEWREEARTAIRKASSFFTSLK